MMNARVTHDRALSLKSLHPSTWITNLALEHLRPLAAGKPMIPIFSNPFLAKSPAL